jgi:hypothetical protein
MNTSVSEIPWSLGLLWSLQYLDLSMNLLTLTLLTEIGNMKNLKYVFVRDSSMEEWSFPSFIIMLDTLEDLPLASLSLTGTIPTLIRFLSNLIPLGLSSNALTGSLPDNLIVLTELQHLLLQDNQLTRELPDRQLASAFRNAGLLSKKMITSARPFQMFYFWKPTHFLEQQM